MERILVIQTAFIGDAILTLPMLQELKRMNPDSDIDVIAIPSTSEIFRNSPSVSEVLELDKRGKHKSLLGLHKFSKEIKKKQYSRIYSPHRSFRTAFIVMQSGVRETFGFDISSMSHVYKNLTHYINDDHEVKRNLNLIDFPLEQENWRISPVIKISPEGKSKVKQFLEQNGINSFITAAPGTIWKTKEYPLSYFREIMEYFNLKGTRVLLIGGENDAEICSELSMNLPNIISAAGKFSIVETIELLRHSRLLICNDSAPTHMGQSADIPVLTLYCSTTPSIGFIPYNKKSAYLSVNNLPCKPCGVHGRDECPIKTFICGYNLKPDEVILKIEELLNDKIH